MRSPDPVAPMAGKDHDVVHIDQRSARKGGKALDAIDQADRLLAIKRQHAESLRSQGEFARQVAPGMFGQRMAATGRVACVGVQQVNDRSRVGWMVVVRSNDSQGVHLASVKHNVPMRERTWRTVAMLGTAQTLAFASTYYLPAVLADSMAHDLGVSAPVVFAAFSLAMLVSAPLGPLTGRAIDRHGGHVVLPLTSLVFATGLGALALAQGPWSLFAAWAVMGLAMGSGLYEAAFSALVRIYGRQFPGRHHGHHAGRRICQHRGLAPVGLDGSPMGLARCLRRAGPSAHLLLGLPLNAALPRHTPAATAGTQPSASVAAGGPPPHSEPASAGTGSALALAAVFAIAWFISTAMATHLPHLLQLAGLGLGAAISIAALVGPAQVAGRLAEYGLLRHVHPLHSARFAAAAHPVAALALLLAGAPLLGALAPMFVMLHGAGNGILTIAKGTLPLALFGPHGYGARLGLIMTPARFAQALAPPLFGLALERWGAGALWITAGLGLVSLGLLLGLRARPGSA
jgi:MFS family permease